MRPPHPTQAHHHHHLLPLQAVGFTPISTPIRGETDASVLAARGMPSLHLFSAYHAPHGRAEFVGVNELVKTVDMVGHLVQGWAGAQVRQPEVVQALRGSGTRLFEGGIHR